MRALLLALVLAGCSNAARDAEKQYEIVSTSGGYAERCLAAEKVTAAWLERGDQAKYDEWRETSIAICGIARIRGL